MHLRLLALAALSPPLLAAPAPAIAPWSWAHVSSFVHCSNASGPLNDAALDAMAAASWTVIEKFQCVFCEPVGRGGEVKVLAAAAQVRARAPSAALIYYFSAAIARTWFALGEWFDAHPALEVHNANGTLATVTLENNTWRVWGFGEQAAIDKWAAGIAQTVAEGNTGRLYRRLSRPRRVARGDHTRRKREHAGRVGARRVQRHGRGARARAARVGRAHRQRARRRVAAAL